MLSIVNILYRENDCLAYIAMTKGIETQLLDTQSQGLGRKIIMKHSTSKFLLNRLHFTSLHFETVVQFVDFRRWGANQDCLQNHIECSCYW